MMRWPQRRGKFLALSFFGVLSTVVYFFHLIIPLQILSSYNTSTTRIPELGLLQHDQDGQDKVIQEGYTHANFTPGANVQALEKPPLFIIHIGPLKTATTTFQCYAGQHISQLAGHDNFYFIGFMSARQERLGCSVAKGYQNILGIGKTNKLQSTFRRNFRKCARTCQCGNDEWNEFEMEIKYHYDRHHNVLYSNEILSLVPTDCIDFWDRLRAMLTNWQVRVFFTYRRHYEWELSSYREANNAELPVFVNKWPTENTTDLAKRLQPMAEYIERMKNVDDHYAPDMIQKWKTLLGYELRVLNFHQGGNFLSNAFCQMIPEASHTCASLKALSLSSSQTKIVQNNGSDKAPRIHIDRMATEAYDRGWFRNTSSFTTRSMARRAIENRLNDLGLLSKVHDFPLNCLAPEQEGMLLNKSLGAEAELFPEFFASSKGEKELHSGFS